MAVTSIVKKIFGSRNDRVLKILSKDVDQINLLQMLNCWQNVYFNNTAKKAYVEEIFLKSKVFKNGTSCSLRKILCHVRGA